jgi:dihydrofolate synthase/folylpolyglutamate synthase
VVTLIGEALRAAGHRVGLYTSPHLVEVRERMMVSGRPIARSAFTAWAERLLPLVDETGASFFEATTAIAFADFAARGADVAVIEVGLGGRLDATNVVEPLVSAVTHVAMDHAEYLGPTLPDVAREKAGIAKPGTPFVIGEEDEALATLLADVARSRGALPVRVAAGEHYAGQLALPGAHQRRNAAVAAAVLAALPPPWMPPPPAVTAGFARARLPGRFDRRGKWLFDVAHNPDGMAVLCDTLRAERPPRPLHALVCVLGDKDAGAMLRRLQPEVDAVWLTDAPTAPPARRWDLAAVAATAGPAARVEADFNRALTAVAEGAGTVLVCGSFHTVGDAMARLPGFAPLG